MALKIRLRKQGRINRPFYRLVVADTRTKRDGKYVEQLGWYNPLAGGNDETLKVDGQKVLYWLEHGAEISEKAKALVAQAAPEVVRQYKEKVLAHKAKVAQKRKKKAAA
jgi:small subunit ribosomal protein S16